MWGWMEDENLNAFPLFKVWIVFQLSYKNIKQGLPSKDALYFGYKINTKVKYNQFELVKYVNCHLLNCQRLMSE